MRTATCFRRLHDGMGLGAVAGLYVIHDRQIARLKNKAGDGNKGTAFVAAFTFLRLNGIAIRPEPAIGVRMMEDLASDQVSEEDFATWLRSLDSE